MVYLTGVICVHDMNDRLRNETASRLRALAPGILVGCLLIVQIIFAAGFFAASFPNVSTYPDTEHYLNLARGRTIPEVRAVLFPLLLRVRIRISAQNLHRIAYAVQLALAAIAPYIHYCAPFPTRACPSPAGRSLL
jgi:hypothetical protein